MRHHADIMPTQFGRNSVYLVNIVVCYIYHKNIVKYTT